MYPKTSLNVRNERIEKVRKMNFITKICLKIAYITL